MEIPLKRKYTVYTGRVKRGAPAGNGDQGNKHSRKHKLTEIQKRNLKPQPLVTLHIDKTGRKSWLKVPQ